jgi:hypothetical protein
MRHLDSTKKDRYFLSKVEYHLYIEKNWIKTSLYL